MLIIYVLLCALVGIMGSKTNIGFWGFFFFSIALSPLLGFAIVIFGTRRGLPKFITKDKLARVETRDC